MLTDLKIELEHLKATSQQAEIHPALRRNSGSSEIRGRNVVDFTSWDFLNISTNPRFKRAVQSAIENRGFSAQSARLSSGTTEEHLLAESRAAKFFGAESAILFSSRNQAILSLVTAIVQERDVVLVSDIGHNPSVDAASMIGAVVSQFSPEDPHSLDLELEKVRSARGKLVLIDSVSFITGKRIDLPSILAVLRKHDAYLVLDESFAVGACGIRGAGVSEDLLCGTQLIGIIADSAYGLASQGCLLAGSKTLVSFIVNRSKTFKFEIAGSPASAAAIESAINLIELQLTEREKLAVKARKISSALVQIGLLTSEDECAVISIAYDRIATASQYSSALFQKGFLVDCFNVGKFLSTSAVIRLVVRSIHTDKQIEMLLQAISDIHSRCNKE